MSGISRDEWLSALREAEPTGHPDALTSRELGAMLGLKSSAMKARIRELLASGRATLSRKRVIDAAGRPQVVAAYVLVKQKRKAK